MKSSDIILSISLVAVLFSSCSPEPVFRLQSDHNEEDVVLYQGMEYLVSQGESSTAIIAYYRHLDNLVIMDLEIINQSNQMVRLDPGNIFFEAFRERNNESEKHNGKEYKLELIAEGTALDPEDALLNIDKETSRKKAARRTDLLMEGIHAGMSLAVDISDADRVTKNEQIERETRRTRYAVERAERREIFYRNVRSLNEQRIYWETEAFRKTDLQSGESIAGEVTFPLVKKSTFINIIVPVGEDEHIFKFRQKKYDAKR